MIALIIIYSFINAKWNILKVFYLEKEKEEERARALKRLGLNDSKKVVILEEKKCTKFCGF